MSLLDKYIKRAAQGPLRRLSADIVEKTTSAVETRLENTVSSVFTKALGKTNLSSKVIDELSSRFGDSLKRDLADKYFQTFSTGVQRLVTGSIYDNMLPSNMVDVTSAAAAGSVSRKSNDKRISVNGTKDILQYPSQLGPYYMALNFRSYIRTAPQARATTEFKNSIILPLPKNMSEHFNIGVTGKQLGIVGATADFVQTSAYNPNPDSRAAYQASQAGALSYNLAVAAFQSVFRQAGETTIEALGQYIKAVPNPHMAAIFNGVNLRQFHFTWTFAPRNPEESYEIKKIVNSLRMNALPAFSSTGTSLLQYPNLCFVEMYPWADQPGEELIKFKPALLTDVIVNNSPNGIPSFFAGTNLPTFVQIEITFMEVEYFTADDYGRSAAKGGPDADKVQQFINGVRSLPWAKPVLDLVNEGVEQSNKIIQAGVDATNPKDPPTK